MSNRSLVPVMYVKSFVNQKYFKTTDWCQRPIEMFAYMHVFSSEKHSLLHSNKVHHFYMFKRCCGTDID